MTIVTRRQNLTLIREVINELVNNPDAADYRSLSLRLDGSDYVNPEGFYRLRDLVTRYCAVASSELGRIYSSATGHLYLTRIGTAGWILGIYERQNEQDKFLESVFIQP